MLSVVSLPSRERGLKFQPYGEPVTDCRSLPSRERGLKSESPEKAPTIWLVAPFAGAWIEIGREARLSIASMSLPSRERGLK